jgi:hypothetical protein
VADDSSVLWSKVDTALPYFISFSLFAKSSTDFRSENCRQIHSVLRILRTIWFLSSNLMYSTSLDSEYLCSTRSQSALLKKNWRLGEKYKLKMLQMHAGGLVLIFELPSVNKSIESGI